MSRPPADDRREQILDATLEVWRKRGVARVRVQDIADEMEISAGLVPYHFGSKDGVVAAAFRRMAAVDMGRVLELEERDPVRRMGAILATYLVPDPAWAVWMNAYGECLHMPELMETIRHASSRWRSAFASELAAGAAQGAWTCDDPDDLGGRLVATLDGFGTHATVGLTTHADALRWAVEAVAAELQIDAGLLAEAAGNYDP